MNEMDLMFSKIVIFCKQYKVLEIRKCYSMALVFTFDMPPGTLTDSRIYVEVGKM